MEGSSDLALHERFAASRKQSFRPQRPRQEREDSRASKRVCDPLGNARDVAARSGAEPSKVWSPAFTRSPAAYAAPSRVNVELQTGEAGLRSKLVAAEVTRLIYLSPSRNDARRVRASLPRLLLLKKRLFTERRRRGLAAGLDVSEQVEDFFLGENIHQSFRHG